MNSSLAKLLECYLFCYIALLNYFFFVLCLCFVFVLYLRGGSAIGTYTKVTKATLIPFSFYITKKMFKLWSFKKKKTKAQVKAAPVDTSSASNDFWKEIGKCCPGFIGREILQLVGMGRESKFIFIHSYLITKNSIYNEALVESIFQLQEKFGLR